MKRREKLKKHLVKLKTGYSYTFKASTGILNFKSPKRFRGYYINCFSPWWSELQCLQNVGINNESRHRDNLLAFLKRIPVNVSVS